MPKHVDGLGMERKKLEDYYEMCWRCTVCGYCRNVFIPNIEDGKFARNCPQGQRFGFLAYYATARFDIAREILEEKLDFTPRIMHILYTCTSCGACEEWCQFINEVYPLKLTEELRIRAVETGNVFPAHIKIRDSIKKYHNPYSELHSKRFAWMPDNIKVSDTWDLIYYIGCTSDYREQQIVIATMQVLNKLGIKFGIMGGEEWCCGSPLFRTGHVEAAKDSIAHNLEVLQKMGTKNVLFTCPGCYKAFTEVENYDLPKPTFNLLHIAEFIEPIVKKLAEEGKLKKVKKRKLTYHDPCHTARAFGIYEPPRNIIKAIPGIELIEMPRNYEDAWCCGAGGGVKSAFPDFAVWASRERLKEVKHIGVKDVVSLCPFCERNLRDANEFEGGDIKVYDVLQLLLEALP
jgi:Fe-S oxidoreductase